MATTTTSKLSWIMAALLSGAGLGCGGPEWLDGVPLDRAGEGAEREGRQLLDFANDQQRTTLKRLDLECGLRRDAARNIIAHRDGADGAAGTQDDDLFDTVQELDAVRGVGPVTLADLGSCAHKYGYYIPRDPDCKPAPATGISRVFIHDLNDLTAAQAAVVEHLRTEATRWGDPTNGQPARFRSVMITVSGGGAPVRYDIMFEQVIVPAVGNVARVVYVLDSCFVLQTIKVSFAAPDTLD